MKPPKYPAKIALAHAMTSQVRECVGGNINVSVPIIETSRTIKGIKSALPTSVPTNSLTAEQTD
jgi:hypothetical protein